MGELASVGWRERHRASTLAEIKDLARELLVTGGPAAISLRAISRAMGMAPSALYRYYPSLEELVAALRNDLFHELGQATYAARVELPEAHPTVRIAAMARAFRQWGLTHPEGFGLILGPPLPGTSAGDERSSARADEGAACVGVLFLDEFVELRRCGELVLPAVAPDESKLIASLGAYVRGRDDLEPSVVFAFLSAWARLYGVIAMEVFGHMGWAVTDSEVLFESELENFVRQLTGPPGS